MEDFEEPQEFNDTYNFRDSTKRRRLENGCVPTCYCYTRPYKRKVPIATIPTEVLEKIFSFIAYDTLAKTVRLVNRRFYHIIQHILNVTFKNLEPRLNRMNKIVAFSLSHARDDAELECMCKILNVAETLLFQHSIIKSSVWRYLYNKLRPSNQSMYGGLILDMFDTTIRNFMIDPHRILSSEVLKNFDLHKEIQGICSQVKLFVLHFDRVYEMPNNSTVFVSGCKMLDILDCATQAKRYVIEETYFDNCIKMKIKYHFRHAWFVALDLPEGMPKSWNEEQRLMYMRLRRIVVSHTEMNLEYEQYHRECRLRHNRNGNVKRPINSVYTGFGEVEKKFFYYGVMNKGAYAVKFEQTRAMYAVLESEEDEESNLDMDQKPDFTSFLGLDIYVDLECPISLAPLSILEIIEKKVTESNFKQLLLKKPNSTFNMKVKFSCKSAKYPRLPSIYEVEVRGQR